MYCDSRDSDKKATSQTTASLCRSVSEASDHSEDECVRRHGRVNSGVVTHSSPYVFRPATWSIVHHPTIVVSFYSPIDGTVQRPYEVWLQNTDVLVKRYETKTGITYSTYLSKVLPAALCNNAPMQGKGGHIFRSGITSSHSLVYLGSVAEIASGSSHPSLKLSIIDKITLNSLSSGIYSCSLFWEYVEIKESINLSEGRLSATKDIHDKVSNEGELIKFLRKELGLPPDKSWPRAEYISDVLFRYREVTAGIKKLKAWAHPGNSKGGYQVPLTHRSDFRGISFTQIDVLKAFGIGPSKFSGDKAHFSPQNLAKSTIAQAWVEDPLGEHSDLFLRMSIPDFTRFVNNN